MKFKFEQSDVLKNLVAAIKILADEPTFNIDSDGLTVRAMDPSRVAMIDLTVAKAVFAEFACEKAIKLSFSMLEFDKLVKRAGKDDPVTVEFDEKTGKLKITITGKYLREFTLPTLEPSDETVPVPKITFNNKIRFIVSTLSQAIEDAQLASDHTKISATPNGLAINAKGDVMTASANLTKDQGLLEIDVKEESASVFSLTYLMEMLKAIYLFAGIATLELGWDLPFKMSCEKDSNIKVAYWLAPSLLVGSENRE